VQYHGFRVTIRLPQEVGIPRFYLASLNAPAGLKIKEKNHYFFFIGEEDEIIEEVKALPLPPNQSQNETHLLSSGYLQSGD